MKSDDPKKMAGEILNAAGRINARLQQGIELADLVPALRLLASATREFADQAETERMAALRRGKVSGS